MQNQRQPVQNHPSCSQNQRDQLTSLPDVLGSRPVHCLCLCWFSSVPAAAEQTPLPSWVLLEWEFCPSADLRRCHFLFTLLLCWVLFCFVFLLHFTDFANDANQTGKLTPTEYRGSERLASRGGLFSRYWSHDAALCDWRRFAARRVFWRQELRFVAFVQQQVQTVSSVFTLFTSLQQNVPDWPAPPGNCKSAISPQNIVMLSCIAVSHLC